MKLTVRNQTATLLFAGTLLLCLSAGAQQMRQRVQSTTPHFSTYDLARDTVLVGTVLKFTQNSSVPPIGAHVIVQSSSGLVDVHLGDARFLQLNKFTLTEGSAVKITGQSLSYGQGTMFFARIIEQGSQALAVRSANGAPLWLAGARTHQGTVQKSQQGSAL